MRQLKGSRTLEGARPSSPPAKAVGILGGHCFQSPSSPPTPARTPNRVNDCSEVSFESLMPSCCTDKSQALVPGWQWPLTTSLKVSHPTGLCEQTRHGPHPRVLVSPPWLLPGAGPTYRLLRKHLQRPTVPLKSEAQTLLSKGSKTAFANSKGTHPFEESPESRKWNGMRATGGPQGAQTSSPGRDSGGHKAAQAGRGRAQPCSLPRSGQEVLLWRRPAGSAVFSVQDSKRETGSSWRHSDAQERGTASKGSPGCRVRSSFRPAD